MHFERSKASMFLFEILINILLFSVLCVCSLQFFIKAYQITENTTTLHHAVTACNNVAAVFQSNNGSTKAIQQTFSKAITENERIYIYLDENYQECDSQDVAFYITVTEQMSQIPSVRISFYKNGMDASYSIDVYHYQPLTPSIPSLESEVSVYE